MSDWIVPLIGDQVVTASTVEIRVNPQEQERAKSLIEWSSAVAEVTDDDTFAAARHAAGALKALLDEIEMSRKLTKTPFTTVGRTIDNVAHKVSDPVKAEQDRVLALLATYVAKLKAEREAEERRKDQERLKALAEAERRINEAEEKLKTAVYEEERVKLQNRVLQQQLAKELALDVEMLDSEERPRGLVPDGRVTHTYEFELVNVKACVDAGCWRLMRWEIDVLACRDAVKNQVEMNPDMEPTLPGIKVTKKINVSVKASARIS